MEYWSARELYPHLGYAKWQRFEEAVDRAKESCKSASQRIEEHFTDAGKIVKAGIATKPKADVHMTRYACYLVAQNRSSAVGLRRDSWNALVSFTEHIQMRPHCDRNSIGHNISSLSAFPTRISGSINTKTDSTDGAVE